MKIWNRPQKSVRLICRLLRDDEYALARLSLLVLVITFFLSAKEVWGADEFDVSKATTSAENSGYSSHIAIGKSLFLGSGQTEVNSSWSNEAITISPGGTLGIGNNAGQNAVKLNLTLKSVNFDNTGGGTAPILRIVNSSDPANGTVLNLNSLDIDSGGTVSITQGVANAAAGWNKLSVAALSADGTGAAAIDIEGNGLFEVTNSSAFAVVGGTAANINTIMAGTNAVDINLGSNGLTGNAAFAGGLIVANGHIVASAGHGNLAVGSGAVGLKVHQGGIEASAARTLNILSALGGSAYGNVSLGNAAIGSAAVTVNVNGGSTINMGAMTTEGTVAINGTTGTNRLNATALTVKGTLNDTTGVTTTISGLTTVDGGKYVTAGTANVHTGGINVSNNGILTSADAGSTITVGSLSSPGVVSVAGGSIAGGASAGDSPFVIRASRVNITGANSSALDASTGAIDLSGAAVNVAASGAVGILPDYDITVAGYNQAAGTVTVGRTAAGTDGLFTVTGQAAIAGGSYNVTDDATRFQGGAVVSNGGVIATAGGVGVEKSVTLGYAGAYNNRAGDLILGGNGSLQGQNGTLTLHDATGAAGANTVALSRVQVQGSGNTVLGDVDTTKMNVVVNGTNALYGSALRVQADGTSGFSVNSLIINGGEVTLGGGISAGAINSRGNVAVNANGALVSESAASTVTKIGAVGNRLTVAKGGTLSTRSADMTVAGFAAIDIRGEFVAGWDGTKIACLYADSAINITNTGTVGLTAEAAKNAAVGDTLMEIAAGSPSTAIITSQGTLGDMSMFGSFGYEVSANRLELIVASITNNIVGDYTDADIAIAIDNLHKVWGYNQIGLDLGSIIYNASVVDPGTGQYGIVADPTNSIAGNKNIAIFQALASPTGKVVGRDTLEYVNGAHNYGVAEVAISTATMFLQDINRRAKAAGCQLIAENGTASMDALANRILEQARTSRLWIGAFGTWDEADGKSGFSGYGYDATGFIAGYDRVVASNIVVGGAFAYAKGDYEDRGALAHDSTIESYSGSLYGTISLPVGLYATLAGGYTYSWNDIRELRRDPSISDYSWAESRYGSHTWLAGANVGWDLRFSRSFTLTPSIGLNYIETRGRDHMSYLGGVGTQYETGQKMKALFMPVDLSVRYDMYFGVKCGLRLEGNVGYTRNFKTDGISGTVAYQDVIINGPGTAVSSAMCSQEQDDELYRFGLGARYLYDKFDIGVKYDYLTSSKRESHWLAATAGVKF